MTSRFAWMDTDDEQRRKMLAVVELFKEEGTVDELGIGSIRDAIADALFPGTSVLHTRARYLLMIPWLLDETGKRGGPADGAPERLRAMERSLIHALLAGGETEGVIGRQAKDKLKRMPSAAYWAAIGTFGLRTIDRVTIEGFLRLQAQARATRQREATPDDPGARTSSKSPLLHPDLPSAPEGLLSAATFTLTAQESDFLSQRIQMSTTGSLLAWLLAHGDQSEAEEVWDHHRAAEFPSDLAEIVDAGRRFSSAIYGAPLVYNRLLAERRRSESLVETYDDMIKSWGDELKLSRPFADGWSITSLWTILRRLGRTPRTPTVTFTNAWIRAVEERGEEACSDSGMQKMIRDREIALKGGRARLVNDGALEAWRGFSGLVRLDYRWRVARGLVNDIVSPPGMEAA